MTIHANAHHRRKTAAAALDWEDLPSLAHLVARTGTAPGPRASGGWQDTLPAGLDDLRPSAAFLECLPGLDVLESTEPEIFRLFFARGEK